jgi:hypothetical protein
VLHDSSPAQVATIIPSIIKTLKLSTSSGRYITMDKVVAPFIRLVNAAVYFR